MVLHLKILLSWLRDSGMVANEGKTEICLFHKNDQPKITIKLQNEFIQSKHEMNVLGVIFDSKLNWNAHIANAIKKAKKALFGLRLIHRFFNKNEMRSLLDSYVYSVLYYNAVIWLTPEINPQMKNCLLSISANALRSCMLFNNNEISFEKIHLLCKKCTPKQVTLYQIALRAHKILSEMELGVSFEHVTVLNEIACTPRQLNFETFRNNKSKIGMNSTVNKLYHVSKLISLEALGHSFVHFKKLMKLQFLKYGKT